jgi:hypothetical protein
MKKQHSSPRVKADECGYFTATGYSVPVQLYQRQSFVLHHCLLRERAIVSKTKFVEYKDGKRPGDLPDGFWAYDVALHIFLKHLIDAALASDQANTDWLSTAITDWRTACVADFGLTLNANWSPEQRQAFLDLAQKGCAKLAERESISSEEVEKWQILDGVSLYTRGEAEVMTGPVIELGGAMIALVRGELPDLPAGEIWLYGVPGGRTTIGWEPTRPKTEVKSPQSIFPFLSTVRAFLRRLKR